MSLFVTGTDTGVGKTHIAARLLHLLRGSGVRCAGMKPICCGDRQDAETLLAAGSDGLTIEEINPAWLKTPAAPIVGTFIEKIPVDINQILLSFQNLQNRVEQVIVEGVGGWLVPIRSKPAGLSESYTAHSAKHCRARTSMCRCCLEQPSNADGHRGLNQSGHPEAGSRRPTA